MTEPVSQPAPGVDEAADRNRMTHREFLALLVNRFGESPADWAFECPACGDVATGAEIRAALAEHPRERRGEPVTASDILGQECIGRTLGALTMPAEAWKREVAAGRGRGCDWCAYGLIRGPLIVEVPSEDGTREVASFRPATPEVPA